MSDDLLEFFNHQTVGFKILPSTPMFQDDDTPYGDGGEFQETSIDVANLVTSRISAFDQRIFGEHAHRLVVDLDVPAYLVPSSTPGHSHLFVDLVIWDDETYFNLLDQLAAVGIVETNYANVSRAKGYSAVRLPWVKKASLESETYTEYVGKHRRPNLDVTFREPEPIDPEIRFVPRPWVW